MKLSLRPRRPHRGATLIETALILPMLLMLVIGLAEVAFLVVDYMAVANSAREGARVGAAAAKYTSGSITADTLILRSVEQAACEIENGQLERVTIYLSDGDGQMPTDLTKINKFVPSGALNCATSGATSLNCETTCPWVPSTRDNVLPTLDNIGVLVEFAHDPVTGLFPWTSTLHLSDRAVMRIEPNTRG